MRQNAVIEELIEETTECRVKLGQVESKVRVFEKIIMEGNNGQPPILGQIMLLMEGMNGLIESQERMEKKLTTLAKGEDEIKRERIKNRYAVVLAIIASLTTIIAAYLTIKR